MRAHKISIGRLPKGEEAFEDYRTIIKQACLHLLAGIGVDIPCALDISFVPAEEIRALNAQHRQKDSVTDVLSFPMFEVKLSDKLSEVIEPFELEDGYAYLGDIVVCLSRAKEQAEEYGHSLAREVGFLVTHSVLHLFGCDHEEGGAQDEDARALQEAALEKAGLSRQQ